MSDIKILCQCGQSFMFTDRDQEFYKMKGFQPPKKCAKCRAEKKQQQRTEEKESRKAKLEESEWGECEACSLETFLVAQTGLCGPCCFGEAATINGNF